MRACKFIVFLALLAAMACPSFAEDSSAIRLAVINTTSGSELAGTTANNFTGTLARSGKVSVVEREELELVMLEQKLNASQLQEKDSAKIGGIMGCQYVLLSSVVYEASPVLAVRVVEVETSEIVYSDTEIPDAEDDTSVIAAASRMADRVLEVLAGEQAVITEIHDHDVIINRGSSSGVRTGDLYRVYKGTKRNSVNLAVIRVKDAGAGFSTAELVKNGGYISALRRTDKVEAVSKSEADPIIRSRKFPKKRPGDKKIADPTSSALHKLSDPLDEEGRFLKAVRTSADIIAKKGNTALETKDAKLRNETGREWSELGFAVMNHKRKSALDSAYRRLDAVKIGVSHDTRGRIQSNAQNYDSIAEGYFSFAMTMFRLSAYQSNIDALNNLCGLLTRLYEEEITVSQKDADASVKLLKIAAEQGVAKAQCTLGSMYELGWGVGKDYSEAFKFFKQAADQGYPEAQGCLAEMYCSEGFGVETDYQKALELFTKAKENGDLDSYAGLGIMYLEGKGVRQNYARALELFRSAADKGNILGQTMLGRMYAEGLGVPQDFGKAIELFRKAAETPGMRGRPARENLKLLGVN